MKAGIKKKNLVEFWVRKCKENKNKQIKYLLLSLPHSKVLQLTDPKPTSLSQLHKVASRVGPGTQDEDDGWVGGTLLEDRLEADDRGRDVTLPHPDGDEVCDRAVDAIDAETSQQEETLEVGHLVVVRTWQGARFRRVEVVPLE